MSHHANSAIELLIYFGKWLNTHIKMDMHQPHSFLNVSILISLFATDEGGKNIVIKINMSFYRKNIKISQNFEFSKK